MCSNCSHHYPWQISALPLHMWNDIFFSSADNFVLDVGISTHGDLLLRLQLLAQIPEPLSLVLLFTDVNTGATAKHTIHDISFSVALEINTQVDNSRLPRFQEFTVQVAMIVRGLRGEFNQQPDTVLSKLVPMCVKYPHILQYT